MQSGIEYEYGVGRKCPAQRLEEAARITGRSARYAWLARAHPANCQANPPRVEFVRTPSRRRRGRNQKGSQEIACIGDHPERSWIVCPHYFGARVHMHQAIAGELELESARTAMTELTPNHQTRSEDSRSSLTSRTVPAKGSNPKLKG